jgi:hypothetical protein
LTPTVTPTITPTPTRTPTSTPTITPGGQNECVPINVTGAISSADILSDQINKKLISATRVYLKVKGSKNKAALKYVQKVRKESKAAYITAWQRIFGTIPSTIYSCPSGCATQQTLVGSKQTIFSDINRQLSIVVKVTRLTNRAAKTKTLKAQALRLEREARSIAANMTRLINDVPDTSYPKSC